MGKTSIEWTDASWNPIVGCTEVSPGCANCYAARLAATRLRETPQYKDLAINQNLCGQDILHGSTQRWTGEVRFLPERLEEPLHWRKPRKIFVCDMGDLFHESISNTYISKVFLTMYRAKQHIFQILTKRPKRMKDWIDLQWQFCQLPQEPLPNVWLGVSVENQHFADERIPLLLHTPAALRWISCEPLLGHVDLWPQGNARGWLSRVTDHESRATSLDWVVCGGESGPNARPMHPDWARSLRDQCQVGGVPFFFKQWGEWGPQVPDKGSLGLEKPLVGQIDSSRTFVGKNIGGGQMMLRYGKKLAGRLLDGREWNDSPRQAEAMKKDPGPPVTS